MECVQEECTWSIDTDENDQRQVQLVLAKKEYWDIWPFLFHDEAEGMDEVTETVCVCSFICVTVLQLLHTELSSDFSRAHLAYIKL